MGKDRKECIECLRLRFFGRVQGVGFRNFIVMKARELKVKGFVKNEEDDSVSVVACASKQVLETFLKEVLKTPKPIEIEKVEKKFEKYSESFESFEVKF